MQRQKFEGEVKEDVVEEGAFFKHWKLAERIPSALCTILSFLIAESVALNYFCFLQSSALIIGASHLIFVENKRTERIPFSYPSSLFLSFFKEKINSK